MTERTLDSKARAALIELGAAEADRQAHWIRFEAELYDEWDDQSEACQQDWTRCDYRRQAAIKAAIAIGTALAQEEG